jgi:RNA polymerase sigma-70 factor (ECF subfamily)
MFWRTGDLGLGRCYALRAVRGRLFGRSLFIRDRGDAQPSDEVGQELVSRWRRGDQAAFADLFKTYKSLVYGVLYHLLPNDPELEDVVQTAFIEVFRSLGSFEGRSKLSSWIARVALHVGYHHLRRRRSRPPDYDVERKLPELVDDSARSDPERALEQKDAIRRLYAILDTIAPRKRTVFVLNDLQGISQEEVAEIVGANIATVRTRLFYARKEFWKKASRDPVLSRLGDLSGSTASIAKLTRGGDLTEDTPRGDSDS